MRLIPHWISGRRIQVKNLKLLMTKLGDAADGEGWRLSGVRGPTTSRSQGDIWRRAGKLFVAMLYSNKYYFGGDR